MEETTGQKEKRKYLSFSRSAFVAACFLIVVGSFWSISEAELSQFLEESPSSSSSEQYNKPYFICYYITSLYSIWLIPWAVARAFEIRFIARSEHRAFLPSSDKRIIFAAIALTPLYFLGGLFWFISLSQTTVAANTIIYHSQPAFVFVLSIFLIGEGASIMKCIAVICALIGVVAVTLGGTTDQSDDSNSTVIGYVLVVLSTFFGALFNVFCKKTMADDVDIRQINHSHPESQLQSIQSIPVHSFSSMSISLNEDPAMHYNSTISMQLEEPEENEGQACEKCIGCFRKGKEVWDSLLFMGTIGVCCSLTLWIGIPVLDWIGWEPFQWPTGIQFAYLSADAVFDSGSDLFSVIGIVITSPFFMSIGSLLNIPVSIVADFILHSTSLYWIQCLGLGFIIFAFVTLSFSYWVGNSSIATKCRCKSGQIASKICDLLWRECSMFNRESVKVQDQVTEDHSADPESEPRPEIVQDNVQ